MVNEKRLIDANRAFERADEVTFMGFRAEERKRHFMDLVSVILDCPTVDAVPVDEIRVDFERLCLENQEAVLNVSICGKPNEVKLPFSKEVAEVVHGRWEDMYDGKYANPRFRCSVCKEKSLFKDERNVLGNWIQVQALTPFCPHCGAALDGGNNNDI